VIGPSHTLRVALARVPWPLPAKPRNRDELQLAETLRAFHVVRAAAGRIVARRGGRTIVFRQVDPHRAAVLFRRGDLDEAPVALGDIRAARADDTVQAAVRVKRLRAVDALVPSNLTAPVRRTLDETADRVDYAVLVPEDLAAASPSPPARVFRAARRGIPALPHKWVRIAVADDPTLRYGAGLLVASWRDLGLRVRIADKDAHARFERVAALPNGAIPIAHAVDARLVSPRVRGWREDGRGVVDYARVSVR
jgi:hypothetical protein